MRTKYIPIIGAVFNEWTVVDDKVYKYKRNSAWKVKCTCGRVSIKIANHVVTGKGKRCKSCAKVIRFKNTIPVAYMNSIIFRANKANMECNISMEYIYNLYISQNKKCKLSGEDIVFLDNWTTKSKQTASLDRIDNSRGYVEGNVQWLHKDINFMKWTMSEERFIILCNLVTNNTSTV